MGIFIKVGAAALITFAIALYARSHMQPEASALQAAAVLVAPNSAYVTLEGTIIFDDVPGKDRQPFLLYSAMKEDGTSSIRTKRLILPADQASTLQAGDSVQVEGRLDADVFYVGSLLIRSTSAILEPQ